MTGLVLAVLLYVHTEASEPLLLMLQLFVALILLFVYFMIPVFWISDTSALIRRILGSAAVASFLSFPIMIPLWQWQNTTTERRADTIIQQVYAYQKQHGRYPDSLAQLVPEYLPRVPSTAEGLLFPPTFQYHPFEYQLDSAELQADQHFSLQYYPGAMIEASYGSRSREWHYDD